MNNTNNLTQQESSTPDQTPVENQPVNNVSNIKQRVNYPLIIGIVIIMVVTAGGAYYLGVTQNKTPASYTKQTDTITSISIKPSPVPSTNNTTPNITSDSVPKENTVYLGTYDGKNVLFIHNWPREPNESDLDYLKLPNWKDRIIQPFQDADFGFIGSISNVGHDLLFNDSYPYDFRKIISPKKLFESQEDISFVDLTDNGVFNKDNTVIYLSLDTKENMNRIYQVNLNTLKSKELWSNKMSENTNEYDNYWGVAHIDQVIDDKYMVFSLMNCFQCSPPAEQRVSLILNIATVKTIYKGLIGNIKINISNNTFSYQKLAPFKESCAGCTGMCPGCGSDNMKNVFKPAGEVLTETLP